jgi:hypothetical protein
LRCKIDLALIREQTVDALQILQQLSEPDRLPIEAIRAARTDRDSMVPVFLQCMDEFSLPNGTPIAPFALFFVFHLLGEWREKSAYRPMAKFLRMPGGAIEAILGDAKTETSHRVMAAVFDDDPNPLYEIVRDKDADEYIRSRMCQAIAMLTQQGDLPRAETAQFFRDCYARFDPGDNCFVWHGWLDAIAWLGLVDLKPLVREAFACGAIDPTWLTFEDFEQDLQHAIDHPGAQPLHPDGDLTLFGDTIEELADWDCFKPKTRISSKPIPPSSFYVPERNIFRKVGRNDPCPCGSGKKFKKCCLASSLDSALVGDPS